MLPRTLRSRSYVREGGACRSRPGRRRRTAMGVKRTRRRSDRMEGVIILYLGTSFITFS
jgi:hypothetical protein